MAEKILANAKKQEKRAEELRKIEGEKGAERYRKHRAILSQHRDKLVEQLVTKFELENEPKFEVGEKVRINTYTHGNSWEGSLASYLNGCDKGIGAAVVTIIKRYTDKSYLYGVLEKMEERQYEILDGIKENQFLTYLKAWERFELRNTSIPLIGYSYFVEYEGENLTERYRAGFREPNFVRLGSELEKLVLKAWRLSEEEKELNEKRREIRRRNYQIEKERNRLAKENPSLGLTYICNLPETEEEYMKKGW